MNMRALLSGDRKREEDVIREDYAELCFNLDYFFGHPGVALLDKGISEKGLNDRRQIEYMQYYYVPWA